MITARELQRDEIDDIWDIDRSELIENVYHYEHGELVLKPERFDVRGWPPGEAESTTLHLLDCFDRGGWFYGLFDEDTLVAVVVLESKFIGKHGDQLQLVFLHVSNGYRDQGLGKQLFEMAREKARAWGARRLYVSATPSEHTIDFYRRRGCIVTNDVDPELFALEPEDIHLECTI
jgi:predicted N-acetyltransferase YhbS